MCSGQRTRARVPGMTIEEPSNQRLPSTWVQTAIIPMNSDSEANAAASWITALNISFSLEQRENIVQLLFLSQEAPLTCGFVHQIRQLGGYPQPAGPDRFSPFLRSSLPATSPAGPYARQDPCCE